jgi:peptidylprolyl isomerase/FKBP-type peptidyl-prolyl cis-trans isomerase FklB
MKKIELYIIWIAGLFVTACSDNNDDTAAQAWKQANEQAFSEITRNSEYTELKSPGNNGSIYYKVLEKGNGTKPVYYTSAVSIYYKGFFVAADAAKGIAKGTVFQQKIFDDGTPYMVLVNSSTLLEGVRVALQHMVKGDKWEIWIPYQLGHGTSDAVDYYLLGSSGTDASVSTIPGYSTLVYELEVTEVYGVEEI